MTCLSNLNSLFVCFALQMSWLQHRMQVTHSILKMVSKPFDRVLFHFKQCFPMNPEPFFYLVWLVKGNLFVYSGDGDDYIWVKNVRDTTYVVSEDGNDNITLDQVEGDQTIFSGAGNDTILVITNGAGSYLDINAGDDNDTIKILALGGNATVKGQGGSDLLLLDARNESDSLRNTMDASHLDWNGGLGADDNDKVEMYFVSAGTTNLNLVDDNQGVNTLIARCSDNACTMLSRRTFLANIHIPGNPGSTLERVNIDSKNQSLTKLLLYLNGGENSVYFDDTIAKMVSALMHIISVL